MSQRKVTEHSFVRFKSLGVKCILCGAWIKKNEAPMIFEKNKDGDIIRKWSCRCGNGFYAENVSEIERLGWK